MELSPSDRFYFPAVRVSPLPLASELPLARGDEPARWEKVLAVRDLLRGDALDHDDVLEGTAKRLFVALSRIATLDWRR